MRADRPLLAAAVFLAAGLWLIFFYGTANNGFSAAFPFSNSTLRLDMTITGPGAVGAVALAAIGALLLALAVLTAIISQLGLLFGGGKTREETEERDPEPWSRTAHYITPVTDSERRHFL